MSPEQATGDGSVGPATDVWALGCVLYEMLVGEPPYTGSTPQAVLGKIITAEPASVTATRRSVPANADAAIRKALEKLPADRFLSAQEFSRALGDPSFRHDGQGAAQRRMPSLRPVAAGLATVVLAAAIAASVTWGRPEAPAPRLGAASVAVLPFTSGGAQGEDAALFADGIHSEILTQLQKLGSLEVIGHASVLVYEGTSRPFGEIARELGVATLLEATVYRAGGRFRLNVRLIDGATGRQLWAEPYEDELTVERLFRTQEAIAVRIANALDVTLSAPERTRLADRPITTEEAYDHYLRGESHRRHGRLGDAVEAFADAVEADPSFAAAWAALAKSRALAYFMANGPEDGADEALEQARRLAPDAPATYMAAGNVEMYLHARYDDALRNFARAAELLPGSVEPLHWSGVAHTLAGRLDDARALSERALRRDPLDHQVLRQVGFVAAIQWRFRDAKLYFDRAVAIVPDHSNVLAQRWDVYMWGLGDTVTARLLAEGLQRRAYLHYVQRDTAALRAVLDQMQGRSTGRYEWMAFYHRLRGDAERQRLYGDSMTATAAEDLEGAVDEQFLDWVIESRRARLALAYALAGRERDAVRTIEEAVERVARQPDRLNAVVTYREEARVYTVLGDATTAIQRLDALFSDSRPRALTPVRLRLDPDFDALRDHPAFEALLDKYEPLMQR
jgi:TolB-like protein